MGGMPFSAKLHPLEGVCGVEDVWCVSYIRLPKNIRSRAYSRPRMIIGKSTQFLRSFVAFRPANDMLIIGLFRFKISFRVCTGGA